MIARSYFKVILHTGQMFNEILKLHFAPTIYTCAYTYNIYVCIYIYKYNEKGITCMGFYYVHEILVWAWDFKMKLFLFQIEWSKLVD